MSRDLLFRGTKVPCSMSYLNNTNLEAVILSIHAHNPRDNLKLLKVLKQSELFILRLFALKVSIDLYLLGNGLPHL